MANQRNRNQRRPDERRGSSRPSGRRPNPSTARQTRRRRPRKQGIDLSRLFYRKPKDDFKPDAQESSILKMLHLTQVQRDRLLKWGLYILVIVLLAMIQDVIMSRVTIFGGTTDLAVCAILLITVIEGVDVGSVFVLIASCLYYFSGTSPGPMCVGLMTFLGVGACLFRQMYWHRSRGTIVLCAALALFLYELGNFAVGYFNGLTRLDRLPVFVATGLLSAALLLPLYSLIERIGQLGGNTWKE